MANTATFSDPRRRNLAILGGLALLMILFAAFGVWWQSEQLAPKYRPFTFFPDLPHTYQSVSRVHVSSKKGMFDVAFKRGKGWVIASRNDLPASFEQVNRTVVGIASLQGLEPKTVRADWLHYLDLDAPPKGNGVLITLTDDKGKTLASVITGKSENIGDTSGASGLYIRKADSTQSWLAKSTFEPRGDVTDWYDKKVLDIDRARIQETDVTPVGSPAYVLKRDKKTDANFTVVDLPKGKELSYPGAADTVGAAVTGFTFEDAKAAKSFDLSKASKLVSKTFDGLTVTVQAVKQGQDYWATLSAEAAPGKPLAAKEAQAINAKSTGWAYKLPSFKGQQLMTTLDSLLKQPNAPVANLGTNTGNSDESDSQE
ncbi:MAG TPA: DUF4340 domain-containing protein [Rhizomicrobium sp.]|nr:DUF4340 domain-containing protein [Rhizomicrobium sp.]